VLIRQLAQIDPAILTKINIHKGFEAAHGVIDGTADFRRKLETASERLDIETKSRLLAMVDRMEKVRTVSDLTHVGLGESNRQAVQEMQNLWIPKS
jgi:hypothetical protein